MGARGKACPICKSSDATLRARVESLRETGSSFREISALVGLNKYSVARHFRHTGSQVNAETANLSPLARSDERLRTLAERCEMQWLSAAQNGDGRSALDCLKTAVRLELENRSRIQEQAEIETGSKTNDGVPSRKWIDSVVAKVRASHHQRENAL